MFFFKFPTPSPPKKNINTHKSKIHQPSSTPPPLQLTQTSLFRATPESETLELDLWGTGGSWFQSTKSVGDVCVADVVRGCGICATSSVDSQRVGRMLWESLGCSWRLLRSKFSWEKKTNGRCKHEIKKEKKTIQKHMHNFSMSFFHATFLSATILHLLAFLLPFLNFLHPFTHWRHFSAIFKALFCQHPTHKTPSKWDPSTLGGLLSSQTLLLRCFDGVLLEQGTGQTQIRMTITWDLLRFSVNIQTRIFTCRKPPIPPKKIQGMFPNKKLNLVKGPTKKSSKTRKQV